MEPDVLLSFSLKYSIGSSPEAVESISHPIPVSSILILSQVATSLLLSDQRYLCFYHTSQVLHYLSISPSLFYHTHNF